MIRQKKCLIDLDQKKRCSKCKKTLSIDNFRKDKTKKDGFYSSCNECYRKKYGIKKKRIMGYWRGIPFYKSGLYLAVKGKRIHRIIAEEKLKRKLSPNEVVHHINGNKFDNRPENIEVLDRLNHLRSHADERTIDWGELEKQRIISLYESGIGTYKLSKLLSRNKSSILKRLHKWGIKVRKSNKPVILRLSTVKN